MPNVVTNINELNPEGTYTYADYLMWQFKERVELIRGKISRMSPAPNLKHQKVSLSLTRQLDKTFYRSGCQLFVAPFDVRLINHKKSAESTVYTVVQPDLCVVCDAEKLDDKGCIGAPDLIVEILSPGNSKKEMDIKFDLYQENGVREYWMVDTTDSVVFVYVLENGKYIGLKPFTEDNVLQSAIFPELHFNVKDIFEN
ncbi:MAG: Uma2 family endonuclease [Niabella sp.]